MGIRSILMIIVLLLETSTGVFASGTQKVPVIELQGTAYERGYQHGQQLKDPIAGVYKKWKESIRSETKRNPDEVIADFLASTNFKHAILKWTPELWQEIEGMAAGSGQSLDDVLAFQLIDEYWGYLDRLKHGSVEKDHCSAIGVAASNGQPTYVAQNVDIDKYMHGYQVLLHLEETEAAPEQFVMTCAGFIGFVGMNNRGIGIVINALTDLNNSTDGLPVTFVSRGILTKRTEKEALEFIKSVKHASGQNYIIGTNEKVYNFECSANEVVLFYPEKDKNLVYHTNHSLANHDVKPWLKAFHQGVLDGTARKGNSLTRYATLKELLTAPQVKPTPEVAKLTLRSRKNGKYAVCASYEDEGYGFTFSSVVFTAGKKPSVQVTYGSPDQSDYQEHFFDQLPLQ